MEISREKYMDGHLHTTVSDGALTVGEMVADMYEKGMSGICITDHNCFGLKKTIQYGRMEVIPGVEASTIYRHDGMKTEVHILGYFFQGVDDSLNDMFARIDKGPYIEVLIDRVNALGLKVTREEVEAKNQGNEIFGRYKLAQVLVEKGYASTAAEAMDKWIGNSSPYYVNPANYVNFVSMEECIERFCNCSVPVMPVLAHPLHYKFNLEQVEALVSYYRSLTDHPLAIEVYYSKYNDEEIRFLEKMADKYGLLPSAGSDRHRKEQPIVYGGYCLLEDMKKTLGIVGK